MMKSEARIHERLDIARTGSHVSARFATKFEDEFTVLTGRVEVEEKEVLVQGFPLSTDSFYLRDGDGELPVSLVEVTVWNKE